jgi:hypothetical protein
MPKILLAKNWQCQASKNMKLSRMATYERLSDENTIRFFSWQHYLSNTSTWGRQ